MKYKFDIASKEELRRQILHIIRNTPNKELAAFNIMTAIFEKLDQELKAFTKEREREMKADFEKLNKKLDKNHKELEKRVNENLAELEREIGEADEGEEWKRR